MRMLLIAGASLLPVACKAAPRPTAEAGVTSASPAPRGSSAVVGSSSGTRVGAVLPAIPTSRVDCLGPSYYPEPADTPVLGGFQVSRCAAEERTVVLRNTKQGRNDANLQKLADHLDKLIVRDPPGRIPVGVGPCCAKSNAPASGTCVRLDISLCTLTMEQVATHFAHAVSALSLEGESIGLRVSLHGMTGPRCSATDPSCGPIARFPGLEDVRLGNFVLPYDPTAARIVSDSELGGACQHDGECVAGCAAWHRTGLPVVTSHAQRFSDDQYCGCIEGQCRAFTSARRSVVLDATLSTTDQGQSKALDSRQILYGFGNPKQASQQLQDRLQRQLTRCYVGHETQLPRSFDVAFTIPARGGHTRLGLTNPKTPSENCVNEALSWHPLPPPPSDKRMTVTGQFSLRLTEVR